MASFGHSTMKPTLTFGTAFGAKNWCYVNSSFHMFPSIKLANPVWHVYSHWVPGPTGWNASSHSQCESGFRRTSKRTRRWLGSMWISKVAKGCAKLIGFALALKFQHHLCSVQDFLHQKWIILTCNLMCDCSLRCGIPAQLRASQIYPPGYGKAICRYHRKWLDPWLNVSYHFSIT